MSSQEKTVRDLAVAIPGATRVFEKLGIDYCCGGSKPLEDACAHAGVSLSEVLEAIERGKARYSGQPSDDAEWQDRPLADLCAYIIEKHHVYTKSELSRLERLTAKVADVHGKNHSELLTVRSAFQSLHKDLLPHMLKEEQVLFPYIQQLEDAVRNGRPAPTPFFGAVRNPIRMMMNEHDQAGDFLRELRSVSGNYSVPPDGCSSYKALYQALQELEQDLHQHIHLENNILFQKAVLLEDSGTES